MEKFKCYAFLCTQNNERYRRFSEETGSPISAGYANGYVAVPEGHPLYGVSYSEVDLDIHGGLTFAEKSSVVHACFDEVNIEYLDGELPNGYWVFGFDTMHYLDNIENCPREWCVAETNRLKRQLEEWEV